MPSRTLRDPHRETDCDRTHHPHGPPSWDAAVGPIDVATALSRCRDLRELRHLRSNGPEPAWTSNRADGPVGPIRPLDKNDPLPFRCARLFGMCSATAAGP